MSVNGKKIIEQAKEKVKKQNKEKETINMKKVITLTVLSTLAVLAILAGMFYLGAQYGAQQEKGVNARVTSEAQELAASVKPVSKQ